MKYHQLWRSSVMVCINNSVILVFLFWTSSSIFSMCGIWLWQHSLHVLFKKSLGVLKDSTQQCVYSSSRHYTRFVLSYSYIVCDNTFLANLTNLYSSNINGLLVDLGLPSPMLMAEHQSQFSPHVKHGLSLWGVVRGPEAMTRAIQNCFCDKHGNEVQRHELYFQNWNLFAWCSYLQLPLWFQLRSTFCDLQTEMSCQNKHLNMPFQLRVHATVPIN